jgi:hypothetical protein
MSELRTRLLHPPTTVAILVVLVASAGAGACADDPPPSTFDPTGFGSVRTEEAGVAHSASSSGAPEECIPNAGASAAAPAEHLCSDGGIELVDGEVTDALDAAGRECENDLDTCKRICSAILEGYTYCGVDDGIDGGRVVRCTLAAKTCPL